MADDDERELKRPAPKASERNTEKALGLEVARLFGLNPRLLVAPASPPASATDEGDQAAPGAADDGPE